MPRDPNPPGVGVGALLDQLQGDSTAFIEAHAGGAPVTPVRVHGDALLHRRPACGDPPSPDPLRPRIAGNTVVWLHDAVTYRLRPLGRAARCAGWSRRLAWAGCCCRRPSTARSARITMRSCPSAWSRATARRVRGSRRAGHPPAPARRRRRAVDAQVVDAVVAVVRDACGVGRVSTGV
jgi:hypothetical protein